MKGKQLFKELAIAFDRAMVQAGYSKSSLQNFRVVVTHLATYISDNGIDSYSSVVGNTFLQEYYPVVYDGRLIHELPYETQYALRTIALLNDFSVHGSFLRARRLKGSLQLTPEFQDMSDCFAHELKKADASEATIYRRCSDLRKFFNYLHSNEINIADIDHQAVVGFLKTIITMSDDAVEHHRRTLSLFLHFLYQNKYLAEDLSLTMPAKRCLKKAPLPSVWDRSDVDKLLNAIDRGNSIGKRDYAILLLITKLGLRVSDVKTLCLVDIDWDNSRISFVQSKTQKRTDLPLPDDVGWAIIDYLQNGRPKTDIQNIFLTGRTPIMAFSSTSSMSGIIIRYARLAKVDLSKHKHGMHSLRHTLATRLIEENVPLSTIAEILGHSSTATAKRYMQIDLTHLRQCALDVEV